MEEKEIIKKTVFNLNELINTESLLKAGSEDAEFLKAYFLLKKKETILLNELFYLKTGYYLLFDFWIDDLRKSKRIIKESYNV